MSVEDVSDTVEEMRQETVERIVSQCIPEKAYPEQWDMNRLHEECLRVFALDLPVADWAKEEGIADQEIRDRINKAVEEKMAQKAARYTPDVMRSVEKSLLLQILDQMWKEHLLTLDHLRQGIGLRAYGQRDPLREYQRESFDLFQQMLESLRERVTMVLAHIELQVMPDENEMRPREQEMTESRNDPAMAAFMPPAEDEESEGEALPEGPQRAEQGQGAAQTAMPQAGAGQSAPRGEAAPEGPANVTVTSRRHDGPLDPEDPSTWGRVSRNQPCPCGSGKKYKHCHGKVA